jgi:hypothetical protein
MRGFRFEEIAVLERLNSSDNVRKRITQIPRISDRRARRFQGLGRCEVRLDPHQIVMRSAFHGHRYTLKVKIARCRMKWSR